MSRQNSQTSMALPSGGVGGWVGVCAERGGEVGWLDLGTPINGKLITDFQSALCTKTPRAVLVCGSAAIRGHNFIGG